MADRVEAAVIVAAGLGSRLGDRTKLKPKGFLELEGRSLIERSVEKLFAAGIKRIYIGTGYLSSYYEDFAAKDHRISTIKSDRYETTSSMYTLYNMRRQVKEDFLLLESDLLYHPDALSFLLEDKRPDVILASGWTKSNDEVYIECDKKGNLQKMSKKHDELESPYGELVGISKVSLERYKMMNRVFETADNPKIDYEYVFVKTAEEKPYPVRKEESLIWCEIDDESHLKRALEQILPRIGGNI